MNTSTYVFWLFELSTIELYSSYRWYPQYICMKIDENQIVLETVPQAIVIPLAQLDSVEKHVNFQNMYAGRAYGIKLKFRQPIQVPPKGTSSAELYLAPVDPLGWRSCTGEIDAMLKVFNAFQHGQVYPISENPYQRALDRKGRSAEFSEVKWHRYSAPNVYTPPPQPIKVFFDFAVFIVPMLLIVLAFAALLDYFGVI